MNENFDVGPNVRRLGSEVEPKVGPEVAPEIRTLLVRRLLRTQETEVSKQPNVPFYQCMT